MISLDLKLVPSEDFINLLQEILMNQQEMLDAVNAANAKLDAMSDRMDKVMTEIATLQDAYNASQGQMTPALEAALQGTFARLATLETKVGQADDLQPDAPGG